MVSILEGRVVLAIVTNAVEALDIGGGVGEGVLTWRRGPIPIELHLVRGAYFLPLPLLEGAAAFRFHFGRVHAPLFPIGGLLSRAAMQGASGL